MQVTMENDDDYHSEYYSNLEYICSSDGKKTITTHTRTYTNTERSNSNLISLNGCASVYPLNVTVNNQQKHLICRIN